jgi:hypothetical protein
MCRENLLQADRLNVELQGLRTKWQERKAQAGRTVAKNATRAKWFEQLRSDVAEAFQQHLNVRVHLRLD